MATMATTPLTLINSGFQVATPYGNPMATGGNIHDPLQEV